jgi:hypothetical protein
MKKNLHRIAIALVAICTLLNAATALAGGKSKRVTFRTDVMVGDTLVKKGSYEVSFDEQSSLLKIKRNGEVVAKATARLEEADSKSNNSIVYRTWKNEKADEVLSIVSLGGQSAVLGKDSAAGTAAPAAAASGQN